MIFVDIGYLFALLDPRDQVHQRAADWASTLVEPLLTSEYVLWELINGFSLPADRAKAHLAVDDIRTSAEWLVIAATVDLFDRGLALHRQHQDKKWSLTDCDSFVLMREHGIQRALSHDRHFEQAGFEALLRRDPG